MPLIGDELRTILGMMPTRDRAGIARGTMADDAVRSSAAAESGNAEGAALMQQGQRPQAPPDIQLPDGIGAEYASGKSAPRTSLPISVPGIGPAVPAPQERVVASSPAAAPSPAVATRASDVMLATLQQQARQQKMMQLVGSLGLIANAFNRNPSSQASTRSSLAEMIGGGGAGGHGGNALNEIKTLSDMRSAEDAAIQAAKDKEGVIQHGMRTQNLTRADAEALYATGALADRTKPAEMRQAQDIRDLEVRKRRARELVPAIAKARGTDEAVLAAMAEKDPDAVVKMGEVEGLTKLSGEREDVIKKKIDNTRSLDDLKSTYDIDEDTAGFIKANPDLTESELQQYKGMGPTARGTYKTERAKKLGELDDTEKARVTFHDKNYADTVRKAEEQNATTLKELQDMWSPDLKTGTKYSQWMLDAGKAWAKATGHKEIPQNLQQTEQFVNYQKNDILAGLKQTGANPTDADREYAASAAGDITNSPKTIRNILYLKEKRNNQLIQQHNEEIARSGGKVAGRAMQGKFQEPNKIMKEVAEEHFPGYIAAAVARGAADDPSVKARFENDPKLGMGPGVYDALVRAEKIKQGAKP